LPGLIILEHELTDQSVQAFIDNYPLIDANNWKPVSVVELDGLDAPYQNAEGTTGPVTAADILTDVDSSSPVLGLTGSGISAASNSPIVSSSITGYLASSPASSTAGPNDSIKSNGASSTSTSVVLGLIIMTVSASLAASSL
jgi:chitin deacetylase